MTVSPSIAPAEPLITPPLPSVRGLFVRDLMSDDVQSLRPTANLADVSDLMRSHRIRHVPITDDDGVLVGLVTHRDLLARAFGGGQDLPRSIRRPYLRSITVTDIMTTTVKSTTPDTAAATAACIMVDRRIGCLPVIDQDRLIGMLTATDFVRFVAGCP